MATIYSVKIHYGPCNTFYCSTHKPGRLTGLRDRLQTMGYRVQLIPEKFENYCMIEMCGHEVFRCNLKNLMYNTPFYMDPVCLRAVEAVQEARIKLMRARIHLWVTTLSRKAHFANEKLQLKNHWPEKLNLPSLAPLSTCLDCCGICSTKEK
ncbi:UPF0728 protein v1g117062-like isoform X3 [Plodia interpunctella]|nr:UPF0728 protein v1g117062-like isoform X3 [Plodia interpunctella]